MNTRNIIARNLILPVDLILKYDNTTELEKKARPLIRCKFASSINFNM